MKKITVDLIFDDGLQDPLEVFSALESRAKDWLFQGMIDCYEKLEGVERVHGMNNVTFYIKTKTVDREDFND